MDATREAVVILVGSPTPAVLVGGVALGFGFLEALRVWFPSILFVFGDAGSTSAVVLAAFGAACFVVAPLLAGLAGWIPTVVLWWAGAGALVIGRVGLVFEVTPMMRLGASSVAVVGATVGICALAADGRADRDARVGLLAGVVMATCLHVATRTLGLVWPDSWLAVVGSVAVVALLLVAGWRTGVALAREEPDVTRPASAWPWLSVIPLLLLVGVVSGVPGRTAEATDWSVPVVAGWLGAAHLGALFAAAAAARLGPARAGILGAVAIAGGTAAALDATGLRVPVGQAALALGLGLVIGTDLGPVADASSPRRRGVVAGMALLGFALLCGLYYMAYDIELPFNNRLVLIGAALLGPVLAVVGIGVRRAVDVLAPLDVAAGVRRVGAATLAVGVIGLGAHAPDLAPAGDPDAGRLRVASYNVRFGFDAGGRFAATEQGALLRSFAPDVVVLNEVDRGWLTTGAHDALPAISAQLGLPHVLFVPAADEMFGNALLSRYPFDETASEVLPRGVDPMSRSQVAAVIDLGDGRSVGVVGTHLSHVGKPGDARLPQARSVAATVAILRERRLPTVVLGDLNAEPGAPELAPFDPLVADVLPLGTLTYPSQDPVRHIDHVLASPEFRRTDAAVPTVTLSDHLPVMAELEWRAP